MSTIKESVEAERLLNTAIHAESYKDRVDARVKILEALNERDTLRRMLSTVIDASYGTSYHHIGDGDGIPHEKAVEIAEWWRLELERIQREYNDQKGE